MTGRAEFTGRVHATDDPAELPDVDVAIVATKGTRRRRGGRGARGPVPGRDGRHGPERPRGGADRPPARRLAARLGRHVHERHAARRHARRVHPRHRDLARALQRHPVRAGRGARRADPELGPEGACVPGPEAGAVVEADLQRDGERRRGADGAAARPAFRGRGAVLGPRPSRPRARSTRARPSPRRRASSCTRTHGR